VAVLASVSLAVGKRLSIAAYCLGILIASSKSVSGQAPYGVRFVRTDHDPAGVVYDPARRRFFIAVPAKNEIEVVSELDETIAARVAVESPSSIDLSPDGRLLYVTSISYVPPGTAVLLAGGALLFGGLRRAVHPRRES
jgi:DNA-binding beta-propeller fold protein YncE